MTKVSIMLAQFPGGNITHPDVADWVTRVSVFCAKDERIERLEHWRVSTTPITMARNRAVVEARKRKVDYLLMVDNDMSPDYGAAKGFFSSTLEWLFSEKLSDPCVVAAPYCGPPPHENVYVFKVANFESEQPVLNYKIECFSREEAANRTGFERVIAIPTGLCMIDMRVFDRMEPPWFYYEYTDKTESELASTEDVTFSRDASFAGIPVYVNWDAWAGHWKPKCVPRPQITTIEEIGENLRATLARGNSRDSKVMVLEAR